MAIEFEIVGTELHPLWNYGWFDLSHFAITCSDSAASEDMAIIEAFFANSISARSFMSKTDPWGEGRDWDPELSMHGPLKRSRFKRELCRRIDGNGLQRRVDEELNDPDFGDPPTKEQMQPAQSWIHATRNGGGNCYELELAPLFAEPKSMPSLIWLKYAEFIEVSADRSTLTIAVIGFD